MTSISRTASPANGHGQLMWVVLAALAAEACVLVDALLNPRKVFAEVDQMRALWVEADRVEEDDPALAEELRWRASRIGLR